MGVGVGQDREGPSAYYLCQARRMQSVNQRLYLLICAGLVAIAFAGGHYTARLSSNMERVSTDQFRRALESGDWVHRAHVISGYVADLGPENLQEALEIVEARRRWLSQDELRLFMVSWARFDPEAAFARSLTWPDHTRNKGDAAVIYGWALHDPLAAHEALTAIGDSSLKALLLDRMVAAWAHGPDRAGVTQYIGSLPDDLPRDRLTRILIREILAGGHAAVVEWAEEIPEASENDFKATAFAKAAGILAQDDHSVAADFVERNRDSPGSAGAFAAVARRWVNKDPEAALAWARALPEGSDRNRVIQTAFVQWQKKNPSAAERWLDSAQESPELDPARLVVVRRLAATSPPDALEVVRQIRDPLLKERSLITVLGQWMQIDPREASAWIAENPVPAGVRKQIQAMRKARREKPDANEGALRPAPGPG